MAGSKSRLTIVGVVVLAMFSALAVRLWYLQGVPHPGYVQAADSNGVREAFTPAPRGEVFDRQGRLLIGNHLANVVSIERDVKKLDAAAQHLLFARLSALVGRSKAGIEALMNDARYSPLLPVPVASDVSDEIATFIGEHEDQFPYVTVTSTNRRDYPYTRSASHVLGYAGAINSFEFDARKDQGYLLGDSIGKTGIEAGYERDLRGTHGRQTIQVDSKGRQLNVISQTEPIPGNSVQLTLDLDVQRTAERALTQQILDARKRRANNDKGQETAIRLRAPGGSVVVMEVDTGAIVAMASFPNFDPSEFIDGVSQSRLDELNAPAQAFPLTNRTIQGQYAPGSVWKPVSAIAGAESGLFPPGRVIFDDTGCIKLGRKQELKCNAESQAKGPVDMQRSLTVSDDVYYYKLGFEMTTELERGPDEAIQQVARRLGFDAKTGIELAGEQDGRVPDRAWKAKVHAANPKAFPYSTWLGGDSANLAVGQGDLLVTPLQLARGYAAIANGGTLVTPHLGDRILSNDGKQLVRAITPPSQPVTIPGDARTAIMNGLRGVVYDIAGTAHDAFQGFPVAVAGKTGTAQVRGKQDTSLFVALVPYEQPKYVIVSVVEQGGFGAQTAAPITREVAGVLLGLSAPPPDPLVGQQPVPPIVAADPTDPATASTVTGLTAETGSSPLGGVVPEPDPIIIGAAPTTAPVANKERP